MIFRLFALSLTLVATHASAESTLEDFKMRETEWVAAIKNGDKTKLAKILDRMLADDFVYQHGSGQEFTKAEYTKLLMTNGITVTRMGPMDIRVRDYGEVVVTHGASDLAGLVFYEHAYDGRLRFVNIWKKDESGDWKLHHRNSELIEIPRQ